MALLAVLSGGAASAQQAAPPPTPVTVVEVQPEDVTLTSTLPGRVAASAEAEVRPQVNGIIIERLFQEGAHVEQGDALFHIDPATYAAAVAQAKAGVAQAEAEQKRAKNDAGRLIALQERNVVSEQALDEATSARDSADAALEVARAGLRAAEIELERTTITARLSGEIGLAKTSPGALVTASQAEPLAVIRNIDPVDVDVTQSAADLLRWRRGEDGATRRLTDDTVHLTLADGSVYDGTGKLTAAEPNVHPQTGVITLRMEFPNPDRLLLPGMFVQVDIPVDTARQVFLVPQEGVTRDRRGRPVAWVVNAENVIEERALEILQDMGANWVVSEGLAPGDRVMVEGFQKTAPGATVAPEPRADAPAADE